MRHHRIVIASVAAAALSPLVIVEASGGPGSPTIAQDAEDEERAYELALGRMTFEANCLMCHTGAMTEGLRLTPEQWAGEVEKMTGWGSPVPPEEQDRLVDYLVTTYPTEAPTVDPPLMPLDEAAAPTRPATSPEALPTGSVEAGAALYVEHCATCHGKDARGGDLGINLVARPVLLRPAEYAKVVHDGRHRMPGFLAVLNEQQEADLLAWLRSRSE